MWINCFINPRYVGRRVIVVTSVCLLDGLSGMAEQMGGQISGCFGMS